MFRVRACLYRLGCWEFLLKPLLYKPKRVASANIVSASTNNTEEGGSSLKKFWESELLACYFLGNFSIYNPVWLCFVEGKQNL